jgi:hypothetical protein
LKTLKESAGFMKEPAKTCNFIEEYLSCFFNFFWGEPQLHIKSLPVTSKSWPKFELSLEFILVRKIGGWFFAYQRLFSMYCNKKYIILSKLL